MLILHCEDIHNVGPDGQTQEWDMARFSSDIQVVEAIQHLNTKYTGKFHFTFHNEEILPLNPSIGDLERLLGGDACASNR